MVLNRDCQHYGVVSFETIGPPSVTFIDLPKDATLRRRECGAREVQVLPDWPAYLASS
ncbi:hypothetical protein [Methylocystis sp. SB2]|uniref:hypothetical protein n=1 Tax=Methylocystis sp. (strain SB2) TaxID=743836 RepID=UPI00040F81AC|nr:hypothetical protein [Methylocystis sp. SB2]ULO24145.1 hypothetical protein LNB28_01665 [Methylocystis sp. SB2]